MAISPLKTSSYARNIYLRGIETFTNIPAEYVQPVKQWAADKYYIDDIDYAASKGWITLAERDETVNLKGPEDPQYLPVTMQSDESI
jgi:hypothetical protein